MTHHGQERNVTSTNSIFLGFLSDVSVKTKLKALASLNSSGGVVRYNASVVWFYTSTRSGNKLATAILRRVR